MSVFFGIIGIISLILIGVSYVLPKCESSDSNCESDVWNLFLTGMLFAGIAALSWLIVCCILGCMIWCQWNGFSQDISEDQLTIWQLTDSEWFHFLDYIYGPDREWLQKPCELSFCCRRKCYERLRNRQYGHIILHKKFFIIDELYLVSFRTYTLLRSEIVNVGTSPTRRFLRMYVMLTGPKNHSEIYFDLLAPSSVEDEQLQALVQYYNTKTWELELNYDSKKAVV